MVLRFNEMLVSHGIEPSEVAVLLHTPRERQLARVLPFLAQEEPDFFNAFQSSHSPRATATMRGRDYIASFVRVEAGTLAFCGIWCNRGVNERPMAEIAQMPHIRRLIADYGAFQEFREPPDRDWPWFTLEPTVEMAEYVGRLQIRPTLTPTYARLAENLDAEIVALSEDSILTPSAPDWRHFTLTGPEIRALPMSWRARLREWRGIYLIVDETDGARYVGAAYGEENLLGRWRTHVAGENGVTRELRTRRTQNFRFSILELLSPVATIEDATALERTWMDRLHTIDYGLNA